MKKAVIYSVVLCAVSWLAALAFCHATGFDGTQTDIATRSSYTLFATAYMFLPLLVALVMQLLGKEKHLFSGRKSGHTAAEDLGLLRFRPRWSWLVGALLVPATVLLCAAVAMLFAEPIALADTLRLQIAATLGDTPAAAEALAEIEAVPSWVMAVGSFISGLLAGFTVNAVAAFGEEYGWRYYLVGKLRSKRFLPTALFIGAVWGIWHAPIILLMGHNYPNDRVLGVAMMVVMCLLLGVVELYFVVKSGSMWPSAIIHGTFNACSGMTLLWYPTGSATTTAMTGVAGMVALLLVCVVLWLYDRKRERIFASTIEQALNKTEN
ncbi:MAG: CPBP family intramembrane metalloprotease [Tidjanibacter sp.]|nr:CPBP family intramembrane metalloprotease [Tidjanibacter sp.]